MKNFISPLLNPLVLFPVIYAAARFLGVDKVLSAAIYGLLVTGVVAWLTSVYKFLLNVIRIIRSPKTKYATVSIDDNRNEVDENESKCDRS